MNDRLLIRRLIRRLFASALGVLGMMAVCAAADSYSDAWGPAVGSQLPVLEAHDQSGRVQTLAELTGERGLLLFMSRSVDW
ncbi:MAG: hypothetical protein R3E82_01145 [Pseudomonadales bacterium]|nr:hypothetical protein [Pseudomonadales bacterium]